HELKTPLTLIEGYADMLRLSESRNTDGRLELMLDGISAGTTRLRDIIADMIDVSLLEMGALDLNPQPMWLHRTIEVLAAEIEKL
ncbi:histidine kinase dimerization/phospho-acceptor domain-containing protein, partial [Klebsiella pneumoniae]|uniref:histidine kinase dimerization/phospho-acceptor domain-containing protein n=1 Tax=Klebsiella pneumoniae TaxID=573 RepID=UPI002731811D